MNVEYKRNIEIRNGSPCHVFEFRSEKYWREAVGLCSNCDTVVESLKSIVEAHFRNLGFFPPMGSWGVPDSTLIQINEHVRRHLE